MNDLDRTAANRIRRHPERGSYDRAAAYAILDEALVAHVGIAVDGQPFVIPMVHVRVDDVLYLHGAVASRLLQTLASGVQTAVTVTLVDGLVLARSAFYHSMNFRSVVALGTATLVPREALELKTRVFAAFVDKMVPGRSQVVRPPSPNEIGATALLGLPIAEASVKVRSGGPMEAAGESPGDVWTGVLPLSLQQGVPVPA